MPVVVYIYYKKASDSLTAEKRRGFSQRAAKLFPIPAISLTISLNHIFTVEHIDKDIEEFMII